MTRIPNIGPRSRYIYVQEQPTWIYHTMVPASCFTEERPATATVGADDLDPEVSAGRIEFKSLTKGGLFTHVAAEGKPVVVEAVDNVGGGTVVIRSIEGGTERTMPGDLPFKVAAGECLAVNSGTPGTCRCGFLIREDIPAR